MSARKRHQRTPPSGRRLCNLFPEETEKEETIQPSEDPDMDCRVADGPPPTFSDTGCQQNLPKEVTPAEDKRRRGQRIQEKLKEFKSVNPWFVPKIGRTIQADLLERREALFAKKPWIAPQYERNKTGDDRRYTIYREKVCIPPQSERKNAGDERKSNIYGQQKTRSIPQLERKTTKENYFQRRSAMLAQIQERYRIVMLERQKRMKEGQQLLERLRETDLLIDQLWQEPPTPSFAEDPAEPTLDENYGIPSSSEENPGPSSQPVDVGSTSKGSPIPHK
ncbi:uncharacterized protein LOC143838854 [Paroedura picta]|uniref:uncharacterized protein LOC143838854 n=1 Tax=Paroedura picta TaxID=143630 RepID=UPI0040572D5E